MGTDPEVKEKTLPEVKEKTLPKVTENTILKAKEKMLPKVMENIILKVKEKIVPKVEENTVVPDLTLAQAVKKTNLYLNHVVIEDITINIPVLTLNMLKDLEKI